MRRISLNSLCIFLIKALQKDFKPEIIKLFTGKIIEMAGHHYKYFLLLKLIEQGGVKISELISNEVFSSKQNFKNFLNICGENSVTIISKIIFKACEEYKIKFIDIILKEYSKLVPSLEDKINSSVVKIKEKWIIKINNRKSEINSKNFIGKYVYKSSKEKIYSNQILKKCKSSKEIYKLFCPIEIKSQSKSLINIKSRYLKIDSLSESDSSDINVKFENYGNDLIEDSFSNFDDMNKKINNNLENCQINEISSVGIKRNQKKNFINDKDFDFLIGNQYKKPKIKINYNNERNSKNNPGSNNPNLPNQPNNNNNNNDNYINSQNEVFMRNYIKKAVNSTLGVYPNSFNNFNILNQPINSNINSGVNLYQISSNNLINNSGLSEYQNNFQSHSNSIVNKDNYGNLINNNCKITNYNLPINAYQNQTFSNVNYIPNTLTNYINSSFYSANVNLDYQNYLGYYNINDYNSYYRHNALQNQMYNYSHNIGQNIPNTRVNQEKQINNNILHNANLLLLNNRTGKPKNKKS